jgi:hypothetical protein
MAYSSHILRDSNNLFHLQSYHAVFLSFLANNDSQNDVYTHKPPHRAVINHDGRPTIVDTLLTLIVKMGQAEFQYHFCL